MPATNSGTGVSLYLVSEGCAWRITTGGLPKYCKVCVTAVCRVYCYHLLHVIACAFHI